MGRGFLIMSKKIELISSLSIPKSTALARLVKAKYNSKDFLRYRFFGKALSAFHLKNTTMSAVKGRQVTINNKPVINFGSANYLGLEQNPKVIEASQKALLKWGTHSGSSRIFVSHDNIVSLENELSQLMGSEKTLIGHNISQIHQGVIPALFSGKDCEIFIDKYAHTSIYQAALIAKAKGTKITSVDVANLNQLKKNIFKSKKEIKALMIDGVYSMQGHTPDIDELSSICSKSKTVFYIDDAHGVGIFGKNGGGVFENKNYSNTLVTGSLQKAFGTYGGFISGSRDVIEYLRIMSKSYVFSGTIQPSAVEGARAALKIIKSSEGKKLRQRLFKSSMYIRDELIKMGFSVSRDKSPIIPVLIGDDIKTLMAGRKMFDEGIYVNSVVFPAVPKDKGIIRISLSSTNTDEEIEKLLNGFRTLKNYLKLHSSKWKSYSHTIREVIKANILASKYNGL